MCCPICGITYDEFRTGYTYEDIYYLLWNRGYKRRNTVLGYWRQLKLEQWERHKITCDGKMKETEKMQNSYLQY